MRWTAARPSIDAAGPGERSRLRHAIRVVAGLAILLAACGGTPDAVSKRPVLESCTPGDLEVFLPVRQGPANAEDRSQAAVECILDAHASAVAREAEFVLLGVEGDRFRLIIQTLGDGTVSEYRRVDGWSISEGCRNLGYDGVFLVVGGCPAAEPDPGDLPATTTSGDPPQAVPLPAGYPLGVPAGYVPVCVDTIIDGDVEGQIVELAGIPDDAEEAIDALEILVDFYVNEAAALGQSAEVSMNDDEMPFDATVEASSVNGESFAVSIQQGVHGMSVTTLWARGPTADGAGGSVRACSSGAEP